MTLTIRRLIYVLAGVLAGILALGAVESVLRSAIGNYAVSTILQGAVMGASFGLVFGLCDGFFFSSLKRPEVAVRFPAALLTMAAGTGGAALAILLSAQLLLLFTGLGSSGFRNTPLIFAQIRGFAWMIPGGLIGAAQGFIRRSPARAAGGALGGMAGAFLGGAVMELAGILMPANIWLRAAGFVLMGVSLGFALGWFEARFAYGRLKVLSGAAKNRDLLLVDRRLSLGSGKGDQLAFSRYDDLLPRHAILHRQGDDVFIEKQSGPVSLNVREIDQRHLLRYGDVLEAGGLRLLYLPR